MRVPSTSETEPACFDLRGLPHTVALLGTAALPIAVLLGARGAILGGILVGCVLGTGNLAALALLVRRAQERGGSRSAVLYSLRWVIVTALLGTALLHLRLSPVGVAVGAAIVPMALVIWSLLVVSRRFPPDDDHEEVPHGG